MAAPPTVAPTPEALLQCQIHELLKKEHEVYTLYPNRIRWTEALRSLLRDRLLPKEIWAQDGVKIEIPADGITGSDRDGQVIFHCWEKNHRATTLVEGRFGFHLGRWDRSTKSYPVTIAFRNLILLSRETQTQIRAAKNSVPPDPRKCVTAKELSNLQKLEDRIAQRPMKISGSYHAYNDPYFAAPALERFLRERVFDDPQSQFEIRSSYLGLTPEGNLRFGFYRAFQKKTTYREAVLRFRPTSNSSKFFDILEIRNPAAPKAGQTQP
jgi:hypothetical protein